MTQLKDMSLTWCREAIKAIRDVKRKYRGEKQKSKYAVAGEDGDWTCPLCKLDSWFTSEDCRFCPRLLLECRKCTGPTDYEDQPIPDRIARLDRWEATIQDEIKRRTS